MALVAEAVDLAVAEVVVVMVDVVAAGEFLYLIYAYSQGADDRLRYGGGREGGGG